MTNLSTFYSAILLCILALSGSRAAGVRTTTSTSPASSENLYGSAPQPQPASSSPDNDSNAPSSSSNSAPQTTAPLSVFPTSQLTIFAVDIHFVGGYDLSSSYIAYHFCGAAPGVTQCDVYDGVGPDARLRAVELIVSGDVFKTFSDREKRLWHSHAFAVTSGIFVLPEVSPDQELGILQSLIGTYGKVTDFYHPGSDVPIGEVQTSYGWTSNDQVNEDLVREMDRVLSLTTTFEQRREARRGLTVPAAIEGQDSYRETGRIAQYEVETIRVNKKTGEPL